MRISAIIVAAGAGARLGGTLPKQFQLLGGRPILYYSVRAFERCELVSEMVLVVASEWLTYVSQEIVDKYELTKVRKIVSGGVQRQDSVYAGLQALEDEPNYVAIHDAARPFIKSAKIEEVARAARDSDAAILAVRPKDTIKIGTEEFVHETPAREHLWLVQTPQAFKAALIMEAHRRAREDGIYDTDDAALVERLGHRVKVVLGEDENIKITVPLDLKIAAELIMGLS